MACLENLIQVIFSVWVQFPKEPSVFVTVAHHHAGLKRDAASIWLEDITRSSFKICLRELQNYAGSHEDIYVVCSILHFLPFYVLLSALYLLRVELSQIMLLPGGVGQPDNMMQRIFSFFTFFFSFFFFFFSFHRTGWLFRHLTSPCSQNTAQFILQTLRSLQPGKITHSARSV